MAHEKVIPALQTFFVRKEKLVAPQGLPSYTPRVLVFAADPMRPSSTETNVFGAEFSRSPQLRPAANPTLKDHAVSLSAISHCGSGNISPHSIRAEAGISPDRLFVGR